jgi:hypothetical protein
VCCVAIFASAREAAASATIRQEDSLNQSTHRTTSMETLHDEMRRVYRAWDAAISAGQIDALVQLYAVDAEIESPLIYEFTAGKIGVLPGREAFRSLYEGVARQKPDIIRPFHHDEYLTDDHRILWEYSRVMPSGERCEFVESWHFNDRHEIQRHRVYLGWSRIANVARKGFGSRRC